MADKHHLFTVFELANRAKHEFYIGATDQDFSEFISRTLSDPPSDIRHWRLDHGVNFRSLAFGMQRRDAASFVRRYSKTLAERRQERVLRSSALD